MDEDREPQQEAEPQPEAEPLLVKRTDGSCVDESRPWVVFLHSPSLCPRADTSSF